MKPFLSICMIVKNEERVLKRCLDSVINIADEIVIVDTGSTDSTKDIAADYTNFIYNYKWDDDFSKARNFAASKASGEWIMAIDADEYVDRESFMRFKEKLIDNPFNYNIFHVQIVNFLGINGIQTSLNYHERIYKNDSSIYFYRNIHEMLKHKDGYEKGGFADLQLFHSGYMKNTLMEKNKSNRNLQLLKNKKDKEPIDYYFIGNEYHGLGELDRAVEYYKKGYQLSENINYDWVKKLLVRLVICLHITDRSNEALEIVDACEGVFINLVDFKFLKGKIYFDEGKVKETINIFEGIIENKDNLIADTSIDYLEYLPHKYLGELYEKENELQLAVHHFSKTVSINDTDDYVWIRLLNLLAKHTTLEEFSDFLNNNLLNKTNMTPLRVIKMLLSVRNINVQKLTRSLLEEPELSLVEREALYIKNLFLDGDRNQIVLMLSEKSTNGIVSLLSKGIFTLMDFIILTIEIDSVEFKKILFDIRFDEELNNLFNLLFEKNIFKKLDFNEEKLFISTLQQAEELGCEKAIGHLKNKIGYLSKKAKMKI